MKNMKNLKLGIIGFGKMSEALVAGALNQKIISPKNIFIVQHRRERDVKMKKKYGVQIVKNLADLTANSHVILLGVKPAQMQAVLVALRPFLKNHTLWSVAAGLTIAFYEKYLGKTVSVIRLLPNTPVQLGHGVTGLFAKKNIKTSRKKICHDFFKSLGLVYEVSTESQMNAIIPVSGSGPAFVYQYALAAINAATALGFSAAAAQQLTLHTLLGAVHMLLQTGNTPADLIAEVASPKGTTRAGLAVLAENGFNALIQKCFAATVKRAADINQEMELS